MEAHTPVQFDKAIVFFNPVSTHAGAVQRRIGELRSILGEDNVMTIETSPDGREANASLLKKVAGSFSASTLLCIAAGDGTTNQIIEALLMSPKLSNKARTVPVLPLWGGNANDLAHMLNGPAYKAKLKDILSKGRIVPIHPLQCDMTSRGGKTKTRLAASYASLGMGGFVAKRLIQPAYRQSKLHRIPGGTTIKDILIVFGVLMDAPSFGIKEHGDVRSVYELSFYNGSRMGKIGRLPVRLTDEMFYLNSFENKRLLSIISRFLEIMRKGISQNVLRNYISLTTQEESWAQFDGEPERIPAHTKVQIQLSSRPFYALTTALHEKKTPRD